MGSDQAVDETKAQLILDAFRRLWTAGMPPTVRELAKAAGLPHSTVHTYLPVLARRGLVILTPAKARAMRPGPNLAL